MSQNISNYFSIPQSLFNNLTKEQQALLSLIDDLDPEIWLSISSKIIEVGKSILVALQYILDHALVNNNDLLLDRIKYLIRSIKQKQLLETLEQGRDQDEKSGKDFVIDEKVIISCLLLIDEIILFRKIDRNFILDEYDGMKKQIWLQTNFYMPMSMQLQMMVNVFTNQLNFKYSEMNLKLEDNLFVKSLMDKSADESLLSIHFLILSHYIQMPILYCKISDIDYLLFITDVEDNFEYCFFSAPDFEFKSLTDVSKELDLSINEILFSVDIQNYDDLNLIVLYLDYLIGIVNEKEDFVLNSFLKDTKTKILNLGLA